MLEYKLKRYGIRFVRQEESYTSQCSPLSPKVEKRYAEPSKRKREGCTEMETEPITQMP